MTSEFITTVYHLVINGKWTELKEYFTLIKEIVMAPKVVITPGIPQQKD